MSFSFMKSHAGKKLQSFKDHVVSLMYLSLLRTLRNLDVVLSVISNPPHNPFAKLFVLFT